MSSEQTPKCKHRYIGKDAGAACPLCPSAEQPPHKCAPEACGCGRPWRFHEEANHGVCAVCLLDPLEMAMRFAEQRDACKAAEEDARCHKVSAQEQWSQNEALEDELKALRAPFLALLDAYDDALCARKHGDVAAHHCVKGLRNVLGVAGFERRKGIEDVQD